MKSARPDQRKKFKNNAMISVQVDIEDDEAILSSQF